MRLLTGSHAKIHFPTGSVTTIGNFDGVHKGHQALLSTLREEALKRQLPLVVILFEPQPTEFFKGDSSPPRLQSLREKIALLKQEGVDYVYRLTFDKTLATMDARDFAKTFLFKRLHTKVLMVGQDFRFGFKREGDLDLLMALAKSFDATVKVFKDYEIDHHRISSTRIRQNLQAGQLLQAKALLGRDYSLCGRVIQGQGLGRQWGIPTANIKLNRPPLPLNGVFCVKVKRQTGDFLKGVANLGLRPTLNGVTMVLEIHLFDFNDSLYGELLQVFFLHKLRDEKKFPSIADLIHQIHQDIAATKDYFNRDTL